MLRWLLMALLAANLAFFAWTQGWLDSVVGVRASGDREPGRLALQVRPDSVVILTPNAAATAAAAASAASASAASATSATPPASGTSPASSASVASGVQRSTSCWEAGPFTAPQLASAEAVLAGVMPAGAWSRVPVDAPGSWTVYMGPYPSADLRSKKEAELKRRGLKFEPLQLPLELTAEQRKSLGAQLIPGLSLGRYTSMAAAEVALSEFNASGVHSARVVELLKPYAAQSLRVAQAEPSLATRLEGLTAASTGNTVKAVNTGGLNKPFSPCVSPP